MKKYDVDLLQNLALTPTDWQHIIFNVTPENFESVALQVFRYQYAQVAIYKQYCDALQKNPENVHSIRDIPFLPISFFKTTAVIANDMQPQLIFESSTTTGTVPSRHIVADKNFYEKSSTDFFLNNYPKLPESSLFALLPNYIERGNSSLVYMTNQLMKISKKGEFFLYNFEKLYDEIMICHSKNEAVILIGVAYALYDFASQYRLPDNLQITIIETGGMKGRKEEITRTELHQYLQQKLNVSAIHAEYGMTELLSQAYCNDGINFFPPDWMRFYIRDLQDPFSFSTNNTTGGINIIDLANVFSCSFIETEDMGKKNNIGTVEILGRIENTATRGCNLLYLTNK